MENQTGAPPGDLEAVTMNITLCPLIYEYQDYQKVLYSFVVPIIFGLMTLVGVIGNSLVIHVILCKQKMRTVTNLLLLNLAFADLSFVLLCPPFTAYQFAMADWPFGDVVCKLMHYLLNTTAYVTVYTLVLISVLRYMTIVHSQATKRYRTARNIVIMICAIWSVMMSLNIPIFLSYGVIDICGSATCELSYDNQGRAIFGTFFAFAYLLPLATIGIFSICILRYIQKQRPSSLTMERRTRSEERKKQASRLIILVVVVFAIFWLPIHIHLLLAWWQQLPFNNHIYDAVSVLWNILAYFNSCVNPIIYNYASRDFRDSFREAVCCCLPASWRHQADNQLTMTTKAGAEERNGNVPATAAEKQVLVLMDGKHDNSAAV